MQEISLRDLCRWDRTMTLIPPAGVPSEIALDHGVSWAVSVRATPPLLPPLRGDELVVLPLRVLEQIESSEALSRDVLLNMLAQERIAAILTEPGFTETPIDKIAVLTLPSPFPPDAEGTLNRMITERRGELYRLGADLSRRLSQATVDPRGIEALLVSAAELTTHPLTLQDADGNVIASAGALAYPLRPDLIGRARPVEGSLLHLEDKGSEWLIVGLARNGRSDYLSLRGPQGMLNESDRLVLQQTAGTCSIILSQPGRPEADRSGRERSVADLLLGRLASDAAALTRGQILGIDPSAPVVVGLIQTSDGVGLAREILLQALGPQAAENVAPLGREIGFLVASAAADDVAASVRRALTQRRADGVAVALSQPVASVARAPQGLREARFALGLKRSGALSGAVLCCSSVDDLGVYSLLFPLWDNPVIPRFRQALLGPLEAYERQRSADLLRTLETYLSLGGALAEAATALGIHRNTLSYRLQRIAELTERDLTDPRERLLLQIALLTRHLPTLPAE